ncbi:glyoxalase [Roseinatronobacter sp.]|uniref:glyoxalase n=1 Tax=Roseinatronobacter sp. TaxID=1945755 RepID=UPI0025E0CDFC|nr:glyoxalase [Rhodobaca sp.]
MTDLEHITPVDFGRSLRGIGVNLLCRDVMGMAAFLHDVFDLEIHRASKDFAIIRHGDWMMQLHADATYHAHPLLTLVPELPPRGTGVQIYLFGVDPDQAVMRAPVEMVLEQPADKPHGLREATILSPEGYAFSPARVV